MCVVVHIVDGIVNGVGVVVVNVDVVVIVDSVVGGYVVVAVCVV